MVRSVEGQNEMKAAIKIKTTINLNQQNYVCAHTDKTYT